MKISEFAKKTNVTSKMLRHYDEIGLLKPYITDDLTGYRLYSDEQANYENWINILKHLDFSLAEIKDILTTDAFGSPVNNYTLLETLYRKRLDIGESLDVQISKKIQIEKLIHIIEREGFDMNKQINLMNISAENVNEILKTMPNTHQFLEDAQAILKANQASTQVAIILIDIHHFKSVNDDFGFEVGDRVIAAVYHLLAEGMKKYIVGNIALARNHGDEFLVMFLGNEESAVNACKAITNDFEKFEYSALGCDRNVGVRFGVAVADITAYNLREVISLSHEALINSRDGGKYNIAVIVK